MRQPLASVYLSKPANAHDRDVGSKSGEPGVVQVLLYASANPNQRDRSGHNPSYHVPQWLSMRPDERYVDSFADELRREVDTLDHGSRFSIYFSKGRVTIETCALI